MELEQKGDTATQIK